MILQTACSSSNTSLEHTYAYSGFSVCFMNLNLNLVQSDRSSMNIGAVQDGKPWQGGCIAEVCQHATSLQAATVHFCYDIMAMAWFQPPPTKHAKHATLLHVVHLYRHCSYRKRDTTVPTCFCEFSMADTDTVLCLPSETCHGKQQLF